VRVWDQGGERRKFFSDSRYGTKDNALDRARRWRDKLLGERTLPERSGRRYDKRFYYPNGQKRGNSTGVPRVYLAYKTNKKGEKTWYYQTGVHFKKNQPTNRCFSILKFGDRGAFLRAAAWRRKHMRTIYGKRFDEDLFTKQVYQYLEFINDNNPIPY
jgi:hypothetical protein